MLLEPEKCPVCGTPVKKDNLRSHLERVHPRRASSLSQPKTVTVARGTSVFRSHRRRNLAILSLVVLAVIGVSVFAAQFANANTLRMHWHPNLSITSSSIGIVTVPAQIGIISSLWKDHSLDQYGAGGLSPLHTHQTDGVIHVESNTIRDFTLHEFLAIWGQPNNAINGKQIVSLTVDGQTQDPSQDVVFKCEGSACDGQHIAMTTA